MQASVQDRLLSALGAAIVVALFGYLLLLGLTVGSRSRVEQAMTLLDLRAPVPERQRPKPVVPQPKARKTSGRASPRNLRNKATEIVQPPVPPMIVPPVIAAPQAGPGTAPSNGASDRPGPGQGAGGEGNGKGKGGNGDGDGGVPPRQIGGRLKGADLPHDLVESGIGGKVSVRYRVNIDGGVSDCLVVASSGSAELDQLTCRLIEQRFRFEPSRDADGRPVRSVIEENHSWFIDRSVDPPPRP